jgi:hypothetical protein
MMGMKRKDGGGGMKRKDEGESTKMREQECHGHPESSIIIILHGISSKLVVGARRETREKKGWAGNL